MTFVPVLMDGKSQEPQKKQYQSWQRNRLRFCPLGTTLTDYDVAKWIVKQGIWPQVIQFHTANPVGRNNMYQLLP
jgi:hypothetical protein